jgi:uncharacterized protein (TIGR00725 family)
VFGSSAGAAGDAGYEAAVRCGRLLAQAGYAVATGGYAGSMEAVSRGAAAAGGHVVGITAPDLFPNRPGANRFVTEERPAATLNDRIGDLLESSAGVIALPGNIGTLTELFVAWNAAYIDALDGGRHRPVVAVGPMWEELVREVGARLPTDASLVTCVREIDEAVAEIVRRVPV